jgi:hypothetical protein
MEVKVKLTAIFVIIVLVIIGLILAFKSDGPTRTNAHNCAVYGYEPDCKTPLKTPLR